MAENDKLNPLQAALAIAAGIGGLYIFIKTHLPDVPQKIKTKDLREFDLETTLDAKKPIHYIGKAGDIISKELAPWANFRKYKFSAKGKQLSAKDLAANEQIYKETQESYRILDEALKTVPSHTITLDKTNLGRLIQIVTDMNKQLPNIKLNVKEMDREYKAIEKSSDASALDKKYFNLLYRYTLQQLKGYNHIMKDTARLMKEFVD